MFASLTPASQVSGSASPAQQARSAIEQFAQQVPSDEGSSKAQYLGSTTQDLLAQMDGAKATASQAHSPGAKPSPSTVPSTSAILQDENPWAHASYRTADPSYTLKLWAQIKPCWRPDMPQGVSTIRLELDAGGHVSSMTSLMGSEPEARARAQNAGRAILACAPFRGLPTTGGSYLVLAPS